MKLDDALKTSLEELRMQMLGTQVLFGFQLQGLFQDNFRALSASGRIIDAVGIALLVVVLALLLGVACQHRLIEGGESTLRIYRISSRYGTIALLPLACAIGCDVFVAAVVPFGATTSAALALVTSATAIAAWYLLGLYLRIHWFIERGEITMQETCTPLHAKIEQMLTEARVILPGAQALLGFQLIVMMTKAFGEIPAPLRLVHLIALINLAFSITLLIAPAAIHRLSFDGADDSRMHSTGSALVTAALLPLACAIGCDVWIAFARLFPGVTVSLAAAIATVVLLLGLWYLLPLWLKRAYRRSRLG